MCAIRPKWLFGMFLRTLMTDGMPHVENMGAARADAVGRQQARLRPARPACPGTHIAHMRKIWKGNLLIKGVVDKDTTCASRASMA